MPRLSIHHWRQLTARWRQLFCIAVLLYTSAQLYRIASGDAADYARTLRQAERPTRHTYSANATDTFLCHNCDPPRLHGTLQLSTCERCAAYAVPPPPEVRVPVSNTTREYIQKAAFRAFFNDTVSVVGCLAHCYEPQWWCEPLFPWYRAALVHSTLSWWCAGVLLVLALSWACLLGQHAYGIGNGDIIADNSARLAIEATRSAEGASNGLHRD